MFKVYFQKIIFTCAFLFSVAAHALSPSALELLKKSSENSTDFFKMHGIFKEVLASDRGLHYQNMKELVAKLQELDPDYATRILEIEDFWKLSFLLENGWDVTQENSKGRDLLTEAIYVYHMPNIELVLKSGGTRILLAKSNKEILKTAEAENDNALENLLSQWEQWALNPSKFPNFLEGQPETYRVEGIYANDGLSAMAPSAASPPPPAPVPAPAPVLPPLAVNPSDPPVSSAPPPPPPLRSRSVPKGIAPNPNAFEVEVPYGTNRAMDSSKKNEIHTTSGAEAFYSYTDSGKISYGIAKVSIPKIHKKGQLEERGFFEFKWDPKKHVLLKDLTLISSETDFFKKVGAMIQAREAAFPDEATSKELFVYIHGFNVDFSYAMRKTAQLMFDMDYPGLSLAYSWPARAVKLPLPQDFRDDVLRAEASIAMLEEFLNKLRAEYPDRKINVIAHSLGTRVLSRVLLNIAKNLDAKQIAEGAKVFGQVILAAPAIDAQDFIQDWAPIITPLCDRVSIMASDDDYALKVQSLAEELKSFPLGLWTDTQAALALDIFNFDISKLSSGTFSLDHSVYSQVPHAIDHMGMMLKKKPSEEALSQLPYAKYLESQERTDFFSLLKRKVWDFIEQD